MDCKNCGGMMIAKGNGVYKCKFCGGTYTDPSYAAAAAQAAAQAAQIPTANTSNSGSVVYEKNINGVLEIRCRFPGVISSGSGFLISNGFALTNAHVVTSDDGRPSSDITVHVAGEQLRATIVALGDDKGGHGSGVDLAILRLERMPRQGKILRIADFAGVKVGESVFVIGNSLGYGTCITGGIVSDKSRMVNGRMLLMTDCAVNHGNSGGPIFNARGDVIGVIVSTIEAAEGMNFAIPASTAIDFMRKNRMSPSM